MIAEIALIKNWREIDRLENKMGLDSPKEEYEYFTFGFYMDDVKMFHLENGDLIMLFFPDKSFAIKYNENIYKELIKKFE